MGRRAASMRRCAQRPGSAGGGRAQGSGVGWCVDGAKAGEGMRWHVGARARALLASLRVCFSVASPALGGASGRDGVPNISTRSASGAASPHKGAQARLAATSCCRSALSCFFIDTRSTQEQAAAASAAPPASDRLRGLRARVVIIPGVVSHHLRILGRVHLAVVVKMVAPAPPSTPAGRAPASRGPRAWA